MGWPKELVLVRHAQSIGNVHTADERTKLDLSTHSYPLTERGRRQAEITGEYLRQNFPGFDIHYVSYYERSKETMKIMFPDAKVYEDPRLAEAQRGIWHVMTREEIGAQMPHELIRREREGYYHYRPLGGENWPDIELRIHSFLTTLSRDYDGQRVVMVVHGNWLILFQRLVHRFSIDQAMADYQRGKFSNASVTIYHGEEVDGRSRLVLKQEDFVPWEGQV